MTDSAENSDVRPGLLTRAFAGMLLAGPIRRKLAGTMMRGLLAELAEQTGRAHALKDLAPPPEPLPPPASPVAALFNEALRQVNNSRTLPAAARTIEKALKKAPNDVSCLALAVMVYTIMGKHAVAETHGRRAVALAPRVPALHVNLGNCLRDHQQFEAALQSYQAALALMPDLIQARFNLAQCLAQLNRPQEAEAAYEAVLTVPATNLPAMICHASSLIVLERLAAAEACLRKVLEQEPNHVQALNDLASVYRRTRRHDMAEPLLEKALEIDKGYWQTHVSFAGLYNETNRYVLAEQSARRAFALNQTDPGIHMALAFTLGWTGKLDEAERFARQATKLRRGRPVVALAGILEKLGRFDEARTIVDAIVTDEPKKGSPHFTRAHHLLREGEFIEGFKEYEWRWLWDQNPEELRPFTQPKWTPAVRKGSQVLIFAEQGLGDSLQFLRYVPLVAEMGFRPIVELQEPLVRMARLAGVPNVIARGDMLPPFDTQIPFLSLPFALGTTIDTIPTPGGYLRPGVGLVEQWRHRLQPDGRRLVGISWSGNPRHANDINRSIGLDRLETLLSQHGVRFISLQKIVAPSDADTLALFSDRLDSSLIADSQDFADSAALVSLLDLVISIDSAVVHLAGALGKTGWVLLPHLPDFRWLRGRGDSVWYRSLRLYRQPSHGDWDSVLQQITRDLNG